MGANLKTGFWVSAALRLADAADRPAMVVRKGDPDAGGVLAMLRARDGMVVVLSQVRLADGALGWMRGTGADPVPQAAADAYVARRVGFDPDLWVVEFDSPDHRPPFEATLA